MALDFRKQTCLSFANLFIEVKQFWQRALDAYRLKGIRINKTVSTRACNARLSYFHVITLLKHLI